MEVLENGLQDFGTDLKLKKKRLEPSGLTAGSGEQHTAVALHESQRALLRRLMLPPAVCLALGCESPDHNVILGGASILVSLLLSVGGSYTQSSFLSHVGTLKHRRLVLRMSGSIRSAVGDFTISRDEGKRAGHKRS